jgi:CRP-like cAMP-binding protein
MSVDIGQEAYNEWLREQEKLSRTPERERYDAIDVKDLRKGRFYWIKNLTLEKIAPVSGAYGIAVYNVLAYFADGYNRKCFPSITKIANLLGCSRETVIQNLEKLESVGVIKVKKEPGRVNVYQLVDE